MRSKVILSVLVCLALLLSFGVIVKDAKADAILFPWVTKSTSVSTLITVVNTAGIAAPGVYSVSGIPLLLHYEYHYKASTDNVQTEVCNEYDFTRPTSKDDIVTFDAAGNINGGKPLFNDNANNIPYGPSGFDMGVGVAGPRRAYLLVDNNTGALSGNTGVPPLTSPVNYDGTLYGEAMVLEMNGGSAWGYIAYNPSGGGAEEGKSNPNDSVDFSNSREMLGEVLANVERPASEIIDIGIDADERIPMALMPPDLMKTRMFMTPVDSGYGTFTTDNSIRSTDDAANGIANQRKNNINTAVTLTYMNYDNILVNGIYDNDETPISYTKVKNVVCTSADMLSAIIDSGAYDFWKAKGTQGWAFVVTLPGTVDQAPANGVADNPDVEMIIGKLEYTESGITLSGKTINGTMNNFNWLRNSHGRWHGGGINDIWNSSPYYNQL